MVDPMEKDTKHIKDQNTGTEEYLEYRPTNENEKGTVNHLDVGNKKDQHNMQKRNESKLQCQTQQNIAGNQNRNKQRVHNKWLKSLCAKDE